MSPQTSLAQTVGKKKKKNLFSFEIKCTTPRAEGLRQWGGWDGVGGHQRARSGWEPVPLTPLPDTCAKEEASVSQRFRKGRERRAVPVFFLDLIPGGQKAEPPPPPPGDAQAGRALGNHRSPTRHHPHGHAEAQTEKGAHQSEVRSGLGHLGSLSGTVAVGLTVQRKFLDTLVK